MAIWAEYYEEVKEYRNEKEYFEIKCSLVTLWNARGKNYTEMGPGMTGR